MNNQQLLCSQRRNKFNATYTNVERVSSLYFAVDRFSDKNENKKHENSKTNEKRDMDGNHFRLKIDISRHGCFVIGIFYHSHGWGRWCVCSRLSNWEMRASWSRFPPLNPSCRRRPILIDSIRQMIERTARTKCPKRIILIYFAFDACTWSLIESSQPFFFFIQYFLRSIRFDSMQVNWPTFLSIFFCFRGRSHRSIWNGR